MSSRKGLWHQLGPGARWSWKQAGSQSLEMRGRAGRMGLWRKRMPINLENLIEFNSHSGGQLRNHISRAGFLCCPVSASPAGTSPTPRSRGLACLCTHCQGGASGPSLGALPHLPGLPIPGRPLPGLIWATLLTLESGSAIAQDSGRSLSSATAN